MAAGNLPGVRPSVLLIEDDLEALAIFGQILRENGFEARTAATAEDGLRELEAGPPAAIVLDLRLPTLDGIEVLRRIRAAPRLASTPVTIITADYLIDEDILAEIEALGAHLRFKPIWEEDLLQIVHGAARG